MKWTMQPLTMFEQDSDLPPLGYEVVDESGAPVFDNQTYYPSPPTPEQAAHIVHCVNNYAALVAACETLIKCKGLNRPWWERNWINASDDEPKSRLCMADVEALFDNEARAVLDAIKGDAP